MNLKGARFKRDFAGIDEEFVGLEQVVDVRAGVVLRDVAAKLLVDSCKIALEARTLQVQAAIQRLPAWAAAVACTRWMAA